VARASGLVRFRVRRNVAQTSMSVGGFKCKAALGSPDSVSSCLRGDDAHIPAAAFS